MAVTVDPSSILLSMDDVGVRPKVDINKATVEINKRFFIGRAHCGLTHTKATKSKLESFIITGSLKFLLEPGDTLVGWEAGFIQLARLNAMTTTYAGRISDEGSVICRGDPPRRIALDSTDITKVPWYDTPEKDLDFKGQMATPTAGDSPMIKVPLNVSNTSMSSIDNWLWRVLEDIEFWTILSVRSPSKSMQFLAHVHWAVHHDVKFIWRGGLAMVFVAASTYHHDTPRSGAPTDPDLEPLLKKPSDPIAETLFGAAFDNSFTLPLQPGHVELPTWAFGVPDFFWM